MTDKTSIQATERTLETIRAARDAAIKNYTWWIVSAREVERLFEDGDKNLSAADLSDADLSDADLRRANLRRANLSDADLSAADLSDADLSAADLSDAKGLFSAIEYMEKNFETDDLGYIVYKSFGENYTPPEGWTIEPGAIIRENVQPSPTVNCGCGVNVGTRTFVSRECRQQVWKCRIRWQWVVGIVVPYATDGKIRAERVELIEPL